MFALVRWISSPEKDTHTVLDADWVLEVDLGTFDNTEERKCVLEWRVPLKKTSKTKWELHDAVLIRTSEKENELKKFMRRLEDGDTEEVQGKRPTKMPKRHDSDFVSDKPKSLKMSAKTVRDKASRARTEHIMEVCNSKLPAVKDEGELRRRIAALEAENAQLKSTVIDGLPKLMANMSTVLRMMLPSESSREIEGQAIPTKVNVYKTDLPLIKCQFTKGSSILLSASVLGAIRLGRAVTEYR